MQHQKLDVGARWCVPASSQRHVSVNNIHVHIAAAAGFSTCVTCFTSALGWTHISHLYTFFWDSINGHNTTHTPLTPFRHTRIRLSLVQCVSVKLLFGRVGDGARFPVGPKHRALFIGWTGGTHISLSIFCISSNAGSVGAGRNAAKLWVQPGLKQHMEPSFE